MKLSNLRTGAALIVLFCLVAGSQAQERGKGDKFVDNFLLLKVLQLQKLLPALSSKECKADELSPCIIEMKIIEVGGRKYCLAVAPDVSVKTSALGSSLNKKSVRWKLSQPDLDSKPLVFDPDSGILITHDPEGQVNKHGDYGDGSGSGSATADSYHIKTKRNKDTASATYLPIILWGKPGEEELCAAIDPKIVNVH